jgi:sorting nexin-4
LSSQNQEATEPFLQQLHSLLQYSHSNRAILKLRDQKQLDFEELSAYLSNVGGERDRLAAIISGRAGSSGLGLGSYLRDRVDAIRGLDDDRTRVERMRKLDVKIKEVCSLPVPSCHNQLTTMQLQEAVTTAHETSDSFSDETLREQQIFELAKQAEMRDMISTLTDGHVDFYRNVRSHLVPQRCLLMS